MTKPHGAYAWSGHAERSAKLHPIRQLTPVTNLPAHKLAATVD